MRTRDVIDGDWQVEHAHAVLGTLTIQGATYRFVAHAGIPRGLRTFVPFVAKPAGTLSFFFGAGVSAQTDVAALPRPPVAGGYAQELQIARLSFEESGMSTHGFRIALDVDGAAARFRPDFHATVFNNPCSITRRFSALGPAR